MAKSIYLSTVLFIFFASIMSLFLATKLAITISLIFVSFLVLATTFSNATKRF